MMCAMDCRILWFDELDSTNLEVKRAIEAGEAEGLVVCARRQTGGYGRQGRTWASPEGGLYLSMLLRPSAPVEWLSTLSLVAGLAVREAVLACVAKDFAKNIKLKWPNDVVVDGTDGTAGGGRLLKLAGISLETCRGALCLGVGVNVRRPEAPTLVAGKNEPAYLEDFGYEGGVEEVSEAFIRFFTAYYVRWQGEGLVPFVESYEACSYLIDRAVCVEDLSGNILTAGRACGIDAAGRLLVDDGSRMASVLSGEVHLA